MCHFITSVLPRSVDRRRLAPVLAAHGLAFEPLDNAHVQAQLQAEEEYCRATKSWCDCGTALGNAGPRGATVEPGAHEARQRAELAAKGWSAAKVKRWIEQRRKTEARDERVRRDLGRRVQPELEEWRDALGDIARAAGRVGLLLHWYRGGLGTERIAIARRERVKVAALGVEQLARIEEDVLYDIR